MSKGLARMEFPIDTIGLSRSPARTPALNRFFLPAHSKHPVCVLGRDLGKDEVAAESAA